MKHGRVGDVEEPVKSTMVFKRRQYSTGAQHIGPRPRLFKHTTKQTASSTEHPDHRSPEACGQAAGGLGLHHYFDPRHRQSSAEDTPQPDSSMGNTAVLHQQQQMLKARLQRIQEQKQRCMAMLLGMPAVEDRKRSSPKHAAPAALDGFRSFARPAAAGACESPQHSSQSHLSRHSLLRQSSADAGTSIHTMPRQCSSEGPLALKDASFVGSQLSRNSSQQVPAATTTVQHPTAPTPAELLAALAALSAPAPPVLAPVVRPAPKLAAEPCPSAAELALLQQVLLAASAESTPQLAKQVQQSVQIQRQSAMPEPAPVLAVRPTAALPVVLQLLQAAAALLNGAANSCCAQR